MTWSGSLSLQEAFDSLPTLKRVPPPRGYPQNIWHLFAPIDDVHEALMRLTNAARLSLAAAMYGWDDDEIDQLFRSKLDDEHVPVLLALDSSQAGGVHERVILKRWRPELIGNVIVKGRSQYNAISHDKMIVVDGVVTICGSTNLSTSGETKQNNELIVVWDAVFAAESRAVVDMIADEMRTQMQEKR